MKINDSDDTEIIQRYQQGDERAFTQLFHKYYDLVYRLMVLKGIPDSSAEDFTAEIFIKLINSLKTYRFNAPFQHFLRRIVRNQIADYFRQVKPILMRLEFYTHATQSMPEFEENEIQEYLDYCLQKVKSKIRRAILTSWLEGYKRIQIAAQLNLPLGTIHSNLERGRKALKKCIGEKLKWSI
ncbi:sigma-70 family RNA polymerase sigma factor [candidate division KSB1 bacterium]|nr:sigma-70 family RNA polymerase sigma factor [candidate division KSB1 bacterium]